MFIAKSLNGQRGNGQRGQYLEARGGVSKGRVQYSGGRGKTGELLWPVNCHIKAFVT